MLNSLDSLTNEEESPASQTTQQGDERTLLTNTAMDETSSTIVMIAQSKMLFDRLEVEAKVGLVNYLIFLKFVTSCTNTAINGAIWALFIMPTRLIFRACLLFMIILDFWTPLFQWVFSWCVAGIRRVLSEVPVTNKSNGTRCLSYDSLPGFTKSHSKLNRKHFIWIKKHLHVTIVLIALRLPESSNKTMRGNPFLFRTSLAVVKIWNVCLEDPKNGAFKHV